ncbi:uncharacterized protein DFL_001181 [Arthrobotrys flagrans]|uniref:Uncharacterized protein n=1 Tax=Arthrobotrys flagrans TaxID=97331 RepID=A0A437AGD2_ARTFL|nr:hypothetical protein DFL_001181 [Arthrobotrys flagrans]
MIRTTRILFEIWNWTAGTSNVQLLNTIWGLLSTPEVSDPVNTVLTLDYHWDENRVKTHIKDHAKKMKEELITEIESLSQYSLRSKNK